MQEARDWCFVTGAHDDGLLLELIAAARDAAEQYTGRALVTQTRKLTMDNFPGYYGCVLLPFPPLQSVTTVTYYDSEDVLQTMDDTLYEVDATREPGRLTPIQGGSWESADLRLNAVEVTYVCGYGDRYAVPERFKQAIRLLVKHSYDNRESLEIPQTFYRLLNDYRIWI